MDDSKRAEIATILTIGVLVIIGISTFVSSFFLTKTKQTTKTKASCSKHLVPEDYEACIQAEKEEKPTAAPAPAVVEEHHAKDEVPPPAGNQQSEADQQRQEQRQERQRQRQTETPATPTAPPSGYEATKTERTTVVIPTLPPEPPKLPDDTYKPGDFEKWHCPGPQCDKCGKNGFWSQGCQEFANSPKGGDAPYAAHFIWQQQKEEYTKQLTSAGVYQDAGSCSSVHTADIHKGAGSCAQFTDASGNRYWQYQPNKTEQAPPPFDLFRSPRECAMAYDDCEGVPGSPGVYASRSQMNAYLYSPDKLRSDNIFSKAECNSRLEKAGNGACQLITLPTGETMYQYISQNQYLSNALQQNVMTQNTCQQRVDKAGNGGCIPNGLSPNGEMMYQYVSQSDYEKKY